MAMAESVGRPSCCGPAMHRWREPLAIPLQVLLHQGNILQMQPNLESNEPNNKVFASRGEPMEIKCLHNKLLPISTLSCLELPLWSRARINWNGKACGCWWMRRTYLFRCGCHSDSCVELQCTPSGMGSGSSRFVGSASRTVILSAVTLEPADLTVINNA